jgi:hypothetical protein
MMDEWGKLMLEMKEVVVSRMQLSFIIQELRQTALPQASSLEDDGSSMD